MEIIKCKYCWNDFIKKTYNQIMCRSKECIMENRRINRRNDYRKHTERYKADAMKLRYTLKCITCWNNFLWYSKKWKHCSKKCQIISLKENRIWENNPSFRNWWYSLWNKKNHQFKDYFFRKTCKEYDKEMLNKFWYKFCENCSINNSLRWEHHHIIFRSEKPRHEYLHDKRNIIHLCIKCHNMFHKDKSIRIPLIMERKLNELFWNEILFI